MCTQMWENSQQSKSNNENLKRQQEDIKENNFSVKIYTKEASNGTSK